MMAGKNERAATLPSNLRHGVTTHSEEKEGLFTKLKKKFRLKKGRYHVDVNTGECDNVSAVSFKKRQSREVLDDESPWKLRDPNSEGQDSTKMSEHSLSRQVDKQHLALKGKERKLSNPETYTRSLTSSEINSFQRSSFGGKTKSTNEYSPLTYDTKDSVNDRPLKIRESALKNDLILHDDSAIDLDTDVDAVNVNKVVGNNSDMKVNTGFDPGYELLPEKRSGDNNSGERTCVTPGSDFDPNYESVQDVKEKIKHRSDLDFDPNYESVDQAKTKKKKDQLKRDDNFFIENDPGYQAIKDMKRENENKGIRPPKTYSKNQSIESLDEPGYESLNDVKKRIAEQNFAKSASKNVNSGQNALSKADPISVSVTDANDLFNDSAIGSVPKSESLPHIDLREGRSMSGDAGVENERGVQAFAEAAVNLTGVATALTSSATSKDSGFDSKERSLDSEQAEILYSSVKKAGKSEDENLYTSVNKERKPSGVDMQETNGKLTTGPEPVIDDYDSEAELMLDPGYAECADAIKGVIPYSLYSEGSGSKMSSCTSLDLSAEDFALEPGYAECADAIKSGAIKKISVSYERLVEHDDHKVKGEICSEIYANPQILFRKRSKLIEDGTEETENRSEDGKNFEENKEKSLSGGEEICLAVKKSGKKKEKKSKKTKVVKEVPPEAPPLPARNYSLYLESEEAEQVVQEVLQDCEKGIDIDSSSLDDAFDTEDHKTVQSAGVETHGIMNKSECSENEEVKNVSNEKKEDKDDGQNYFGLVNESPIVEVTHKENDQIVKESGTVNFTEAENLTQNINVQTENCKQTLSSNCCEGKCENEKSTFKDETVEMENCLHVVVKDETGGEKVLKVLEKQESFHLQRRRESSRKIANKCAMSDERNETGGKDMCVNSHCSDGFVNEKDDMDTKYKEKHSSNIATANSINLLNTKGIVDIAHVEECINDKKGVNEGCEQTSETNEVGTTIKSHTDCSVNGSVENGQLNTYHSYGTNTTSNIPSSIEMDSNNFLTVAVKMKCISVDSDCDFLNTEDLPKLEISESDLESPFDSSDNSNQLDIESESAGINRLTQRLHTENVINHQYAESAKFEEVTKDLDDKVECSLDGTASQTCEQVDTVINDTTKEIEPSEKSGVTQEQCSNTLTINTDSDISVNEERKEAVIMHTYHDKDEDAVDGFECKSSDRKATLDSRLCVVDSENERESDLAKLISNLNINDDEVVVIDSIDPELSDDSAIGNIDDFHQNETCNPKEITNFEVNTGASQGTNDTNKCSHSSTENITSKELHLIYEKEHPNLYEDSEPTHMSLHEALGLTPNNLVTRSHSDSSGHSLLFTTSPNTFIHSNIPHIEFENQSELDVTPPPRPPPIASSSQLESRVCVTDQSGQVVKAVTPIDEVPTPFSLSYMKTDQSEDEAPPAIPPRHKTGRTPGRPVSYSQDFMESMRQLKDCGWYWGPLSWEEAEHKLGKSPEGTFLVRDSSDEHYILSLSFKNQGRVHHTRIEHHKGHFSFWSQPDSHGKSTIKEFIEQCVENSRNGRFLYFIRPSGPGSPPMPIQLLNPVSRFKQMRSLQHMCRFRILQLARRDHIDYLPVPTRIKQYLKEAQYYVESLDD